MKESRASKQMTDAELTALDLKMMTIEQLILLKTEAIARELEEIMPALADEFIERGKAKMEAGSELQHFKEMRDTLKQSRVDLSSK